MVILTVFSSFFTNRTLKCIKFITGLNKDNHSRLESYKSSIFSQLHYCIISFSEKGTMRLIFDQVWYSTLTNERVDQPVT